jgi:glycosyltransferase involved in cell wall biosynthesis
VSAPERAAARRARVVRSIVAHALRPPAPLDDPPLVSVVMPTYNWSSVLPYSIRSVLWQTHANFELHVVGDGCTDDSEEVVRSIGDPRIRWHNLPENSGSQAGPSQAGLDRASGEYVAYIGHDDVWHPTHLATLVGHMRTSAPDVAHTLTEVFGPSGTRFRQIFGLYPASGRERGRLVPPSSMMHRREAVAEVGGWPRWQDHPLQPPVVLQDRFQDAGMRFEPVWALTVFKPPATFRPNSYVERPNHEQREYVRRISSERGFVLRELARLVARRLSPLPERLEVTAPADRASPGWEVRNARRIRGLD